MKTISVIACSLTLTVFLAACAGNEDHKYVEEKNDQLHGDTRMEDDAEFAVKAASGGIMEVELGKIAMDKAQSQQAKDFAQEMVKDHSAANDELKALAERKNIALPATMSNEQQNDVNRLTGKTGKDFDEAYIDFMVKDHKEDIDLFKKEADNGGDADIKNWAGGKVPVLEHHLDMAQNAQSALD